MTEGIHLNILPEPLVNAGDIQVEIKENGTPLSELSKSLGLNDQDLRILMAGNGSEIQKGDKYRRENHATEIVVYRIRNGKESVICSIPKMIVAHPALRTNITREEDGYYKIGNLRIAPQNIEKFSKYLGEVVNRYIEYLSTRHSLDKVMDAGRRFVGNPESFFSQKNLSELKIIFGADKFSQAKTKFIAIVQGIDKNKSA